MGTLSLRYSERADHALRRARTLLVPGLVLVAVGLLLFARAPVDGNVPDATCFPVLVLLGIGHRRLPSRR